MDLVIEPEPEPREREAVERALERLLSGDRTPAAYRSRWREAGLAENAAEEIEATLGDRPAA